MGGKRQTAGLRLRRTGLPELLVLFCGVPLAPALLQTASIFNEALTKPREKRSWELLPFITFFFFHHYYLTYFLLPFSLNIHPSERKAPHVVGNSATMLVLCNDFFLNRALYKQLGPLSCNVTVCACAALPPPLYSLTFKNKLRHMLCVVAYWMNVYVHRCAWFYECLHVLIMQVSGVSERVCVSFSQSAACINNASI